MSNPAKAERGRYQANFTERLAAIDHRRQELGITIAELAQRAGMSERTLRRLFKGGYAFKRSIAGLSTALRELEKERRRARTLFQAEGA